MISLHITNIKQLMNLLLAETGTAFDSFLLASAEITTFCTYSIDGHLHRDFYTEEELNQLKLDAEAEGRIFSNQMIRWSQVKSQCFSCMKGKRTPVSFQFVFYLSDENIDKFLAGIDTTITRNDIAGLSMNLKYDGTALHCTCATSLKIFTVDKSVDRAWDLMVKKFFDKWGITYEELQ